MTERMAFLRPLDHFRGGDPVARRFGALSGMTMHSAHVWLTRGHEKRVALALQSFREVGAWGRRSSWSAPLVAELDNMPKRPLDEDLILEHLAADQLDDHWRVAFLNHRSTETRRQWCKALSRSHCLTIPLMVALKDDR